MLIFADMENTRVYSNYMKLFFIVINLAPTHRKFRNLEKKGCTRFDGMLVQPLNFFLASLHL